MKNLFDKDLLHPIHATKQHGQSQIARSAGSSQFTVENGLLIASPRPTAHRGLVRVHPIAPAPDYQSLRPPQRACKISPVRCWQQLRNIPMPGRRPTSGVNSPVITPRPRRHHQHRVRASSSASSMSPVRPPGWCMPCCCQGVTSSLPAADAGQRGPVCRGAHQSSSKRADSLSSARAPARPIGHPAGKLLPGHAPGWNPCRPIPQLSAHPLPASRPLAPAPAAPAAHFAAPSATDRASIRKHQNAVVWTAASARHLSGSGLPCMGSSPASSRSSVDLPQPEESQ